MIISHTFASVVNGEELEEILAPVGESEGGFVVHLSQVLRQRLPLLPTATVEQHVQLGTEVPQTVARETLHHLTRPLSGKKK